jgi:hypothetical protein
VAVARLGEEEAVVVGAAASKTRSSTGVSIAVLVLYSQTPAGR